MLEACSLGLFQQSKKNTQLKVVTVQNTRLRHMQIITDRGCDVAPCEADSEMS